MAETKKAKVYNYAAAPIEGFVNDDYVVSNISLGADNVPGTDAAGEPYDGTKFAVAQKRFKLTEIFSEEELAVIKKLDALIAERYAADDSIVFGTQELLDTGQMQIFTRPAYKTAAKSAIDEGNWEEAHRMAQEAIDCYRVGRRTTAGPTQKAKIQKLSALEKKAQELGITYEELIERAMSA